MRRHHRSPGKSQASPDRVMLADRWGGTMMPRLAIKRRELARLAGLATLAAGFATDGVLGAAHAAPTKGGTINVATPGEPPTLDPMQSTADVVGMIGQHMFETLYTWGEGW